MTMNEYEQRVLTAARELRAIKRNFMAFALELATEGKTPEVVGAMDAALEAARIATSKLCTAACEDED